MLTLSASFDVTGPKKGPLGVIEVAPHDYNIYNNYNFKMFPKCIWYPQQHNKDRGKHLKM